VIFLKDGSIIEIDYTGKAILTGNVFESTIEKKAIAAGIFSEKNQYKPMVVVVGEGHVLPGLEKTLKEIKQGEERKVLVKPEEGWGERKPGNIVVVPLQQFKKEKMQPFPGLVVEVNGRQGKIQSVNGGRVRIDFNHPLAGKELEYELKIVREITAPKEQVEALYKKYFYMVPDAERKLKIGQGEIEVSLSPRWSANLAPLKKAFSDLVTKHVKGFSKVKFVEEFVEKKDAGKKQREEKTEKKEESEKKETIEEKETVKRKPEEKDKKEKGEKKADSKTGKEQTLKKPQK